MASLALIATVMGYLKEPKNALRWGLSLFFAALFLGFFTYELFKDRRKNKK